MHNIRNNAFRVCARSVGKFYVHSFTAQAAASIVHYMYYRWSDAVHMEWSSYNNWQYSIPNQAAEETVWTRRCDELAAFVINQIIRLPHRYWNDHARDFFPCVCWHFNLNSFDHALACALYAFVFVLHICGIITGAHRKLHTPFEPAHSCNRKREKTTIIFRQLWMKVKISDDHHSDREKSISCGRKACASLWMRSHVRQKKNWHTPPTCARANTRAGGDINQSGFTQKRTLKYSHATLWSSLHADGAAAAAYYNSKSALLYRKTIRNKQRAKGVGWGRRDLRQNYVN